MGPHGDPPRLLLQQAPGLGGHVEWEASLPGPATLPVCDLC